jgi:hypothetical protein
LEVEKREIMMKVFKEIIDNFPNLMKGTNPYIQKSKAYTKQKPCNAYHD